MSLSYKGAWWVASSSRVLALVTAGFNLFVVPFLSIAQVDDCLSVVPVGNPTIILLQSDDYDKIAQINWLKNYGSVTGFLIHDEPNVSGTLQSVADQINNYSYAKNLAPFKAIFASYHIEPSGPSHPSYCVASAGSAYDYVLPNYYPLTWGKSDMQAGIDLAHATAAARAFFAANTPILPVEQACGCTVDTPGMPRSILGYLQAQHDVWVQAGMVAYAAMIYYGDGTHPEDLNLSTSSLLLAEAGQVQ